MLLEMIMTHLSELVRGCFKGKYMGFVPFYFLCLENSGGPDCNKA